MPNPCRVKSGQVKQSIDWLTQIDFEACMNVFSEIDFVEEMIIHSDKCSVRELAKLEDEFAKELVKNKLGSKCNIWRLLNENKEDADDSGPPQADNNDNCVSQNSKQNCYIVPGFAKQISASPVLQRFHLINYRLSNASWKKMGKAIGESSTIRAFLCQACNLYQGDSMRLLMEGMLANTSLELLDFSDNELTD